MFEGFELDRIDVGEAALRVRHGGSGPPLLLLHGHPQTHVMWHLVAPRLAAEFSVVAPDLRGYGESSKPPTGPDHEPYSKRAMARDAVELMRRLGFERFSVAGHDRGARCAYRLALDEPARVERLAVLDVVPTGETWRRADRRFMLSWWHWAFLAQDTPLPERLIGADPEGYYFGGDRSRFHPDALADYLACVRDPRTIHAMCEDYRAGATYDFELDEADRAAGRRISCPVLVLWAGRGDLEELFGDPLAIWGDWADDVRGRALDCGHYLPEEAPEDTAAELGRFLAGS
ncbi:MAG TPA: alpha/beta hydrolase [Gaiellaceae bacterium]|nr:alpha/beta hydrolase [Gaiellaceae bacterium]